MTRTAPPETDRRLKGSDEGGHQATVGIASGPDTRSMRDRWWSSWPWLVGALAGLAVLGPALAPGSLFSLDLILTPTIPVPHGAWGLGPELPRRVPLMVPAAWLSTVVPGWLIGKAMIVGSVAAAFVGVHRQVRERIDQARGDGDEHPRLQADSVPARFWSEIAAVGAGLLYALNPFMVTRIGAGHLAIVVATAILPWALPVLLRPGDDLRRTFIWSAALAFTGNYGGMISCLVVIAGLCNTRGNRWLRVTGLWFGAQLPWLVPGLIVLVQGGAIADSTAFTTLGRGVAGKAQILAGHGFWNFSYQAGFTGVDQRLQDQLPVAVLGVALLVLGVLGARDLPVGWRWAAAGLAGFGAVVAIISSFEYDANPYFALARNPVGSNLRESLRALPLYLVWMAPASALGAVRAGRWLGGRLGGTMSLPGGAADHIMQAVPLCAALLLVTPGLWGLEGHLRSADIPQSWEQVRRITSDNPGTVAVLPWHAYGTYQLGGAHQVIDPWPFFLGGDVLVCSDLGRRTSCGSAGVDNERADPRESAMSDLARAAEDRRPVADGLAALGVRWLLVARVPGAERLSVGEPGLDRVLTSEEVDLYSVRAWRAAVVDQSGTPVPSTPVVEPFMVVDASGPATLARAAAPGWRRGLEATGSTELGLMALPAGSGPVWYWPCLLVIAGDLVWLVLLVGSIRGASRRRARMQQDAAADAQRRGDA